MASPKNSRISRVSLTLYKIPLKMNLEESIFSNTAGLHLQILLSNHMAQWNLFDVVNSVISKFPAVLKFLADHL